MDDLNHSRRKELADALTAELQDTDRRLVEIARLIESESGAYYEEAFKERHEEIGEEIESHINNAKKVGEINNEITAAINSWFEFSGSESRAASPVFPIIWHHKKRKLFKNIEKLNSDISDIMIKNRFIREKLTNLEHQLEIKAMCIARESESYREYESLAQKRDLISAELKYLLPTL